jgi:hypothetical protein
MKRKAAIGLVVLALSAVITRAGAQVSESNANRRAAGVAFRCERQQKHAGVR